MFIGKRCRGDWKLISAGNVSRTIFCRIGRGPSDGLKRNNIKSLKLAVLGTRFSFLAVSSGFGLLSRSFPT